MGTQKYRQRSPSASPPFLEAPMHSPSPGPRYSSRPIPRQYIHPPSNIDRQSALFCNKCKCKSPMMLRRFIDIDCEFYKKVECSSNVSIECRKRKHLIKPKVMYVAICRNNAEHKPEQPNIVCVNCIEYFRRWSFLKKDTFHINPHFYR